MLEKEKGNEKEREVNALSVAEKNKCRHANLYRPGQVIGNK